MEEKNLIKKLEETSLPEIEITSHKRRLKIALLNRYFGEKRSWEVFNIFRLAFPLTAVAVILVFLVLNNLIFPQYNLAKAEEIALKDPQIKGWVDKGATIKDIEIIKNKAYVLIQPSEGIQEVKEAVTLSKGEIQKPKEEFVGALAEIDFKEKKVTKIEEMGPVIASLIEEEKEKTREILENNPEVQKTIPKEAEIIKIETSLPQLRLIKKNNSIEVAPELKKEVMVIYEHDKKQWQSTIDLIQEKVATTSILREVNE